MLVNFAILVYPHSSNLLNGLFKGRSDKFYTQMFMNTNRHNCYRAQWSYIWARMSTGWAGLGWAVHDHILHSVVIDIDWKSNKQINGFFTHNKINHTWRRAINATHCAQTATRTNCTEIRLISVFFKQRGF